MPERLRSPGAEEEKLTSGQWLWKTLGPFGCVLALVLMAAALALCFTAGTDPIPGYEPPESGAYYAAHPDELARELAENVLPRLEGEAAVSVSGGTVTVTVEPDRYAVTRSALLRFFDGALLEIVPAEG